MDRELGLCGLILEGLYWTGLREGSVLSIAHVVRRAPDFVVHGLGELMCEHLCSLGPLCSLTHMSGVSSAITAVTPSI